MLGRILGGVVRPSPQCVSTARRALTRPPNLSTPLSEGTGRSSAGCASCRGEQALEAQRGEHTLGDWTHVVPEDTSLEERARER
jgi:hypothetical protein